MRNASPVIGAQFPGMLVISGSFVTDGANAPSVVSPGRNARFSIGAPSTGRYTVTLADGPIQGALISQFVDITNPAGGNDDAVIDDAIRTTVPASGTFVIETQSAAGTAANLTGPVVSFLLILAENKVLVT